MGEGQGEFAVDMPVCVYPGTDAEKHGVVVEDFGDSLGQTVDIGDRIVAPARRWAVQLDTGELVFVDTDQLAPG
jgi:hypothetical protein